MKIKAVIAVFLLFAVASSGFADDSSVITKRSVDLAHIGERINTNWIGRVMSDVIGTNKVITVVILKNVTSMISDMHAEGIRRVLQANPILEARPLEIASRGNFGDDAAGEFFLDSVVILNNGMIVRVERSSSWGRLTTDKGQAYFRISDKRPSKPLEATR